MKKVQKRERLRNKTVADGTPYYGVSLTSMRVEKGLTQADLAGKLGITAGAVSHIEGGRRNPSFRLMTKWLALFGTTPEERTDIINDISEQIKKTRKRGVFEQQATDVALNTHRINISIAADDLVKIVNTDLEGISTAKLSKQAVADIRACVFRLAEKLLAAG